MSARYKHPVAAALREQVEDGPGELWVQEDFSVYSF